MNPVAAPAGYTISQGPGVSVSNLVMDVGCSVFSECPMWNLHFTSNWNPPDTYNRMSSPFPWTPSRYVFNTSPALVTYVKFHMTAPNDVYTYVDGTKEMHTDPDTGVTTCFARGPGHLMTAVIENLGGTGDVGKVEYNFSVLPGDMGNTGNVSTCQGTSSTTFLMLTSDETVAATTMNASGNLTYCLLREGYDYYLNFTGSGSFKNVDCSTQQCAIGGFVFSNPTTSDGSPLIVDVPCQ